VVVSLLRHACPVNPHIRNGNIPAQHAGEEMQDELMQRLRFLIYIAGGHLALDEIGIADI
jgi:hypothetical protein